MVLQYRIYWIQTVQQKLQKGLREIGYENVNWYEMAQDRSSDMVMLINI